MKKPTSSLRKKRTPGQKFKRAAMGMHPATRRLLQFVLPGLIVLMLYIWLRYMFFESHIIGVCRVYRGMFEYAMLCVNIVLGGALLLELGTRRRDADG